LVSQWYIFLDISEKFVKNFISEHFFLSTMRIQTCSVLNTSVPSQQIHVSRGLFKRWAKVHPYPGRMIHHVRLEDDGSIIHDNWPEFSFYDYSVSNLRTEVAARQDDENITLCVRAGMYALVIPLITDLPKNVDTMDIIVITTGSPGENSATFAVVCAALVICFLRFQHVRCLMFSAVMPVWIVMQHSP
jgi:hypothetical protein